LKPKIYEHIIKVAEADIDELNHVNNVVYFNYLQQGAMAHWYSSVPSDISDRGIATSKMLQAVSERQSLRGMGPMRLTCG
jgi:acyl-CoA thioesterase FadM